MDNINVPRVNETGLKEEWRFVTDERVIPNRYQVSSQGRVRDIVKNRMLVLGDCHDGYYNVHMAVAPYKEVQVAVHRLMALAFLPTPEPGKIHVDHIDGNKHHNTIDNLRWVSRRENLRNPSTRDAHVEANRRNVVKHFIRVLCEETGEIFASIKDAAVRFNMSTTSICRSCRYADTSRMFRREQKGGRKVYHFRYVDPPSTPVARQVAEPVRGGKQTNAKPVRCIEDGNVYPSLKAAARAYNRAYTMIAKSCNTTAANGMRNASRGHRQVLHFAWATQEEYEQYIASKQQEG